MKRLIYSLFALCLVALAPLAKADIQLSYSINGTGPVVCALGTGANPNTSCPNVGVGPISISGLQADSNSPGSLALGFEESTNLHLINNTTANQVITIIVSSDGFTNPVTPPTLVFDSNAGGSVTTGLARQRIVLSELRHRSERRNFDRRGLPDGKLLRRVPCPPRH